MFKNFMSFNLFMSVLCGRSLIWLFVIFLNAVYINGISFKTRGRLTSEGKTSPIFVKIMRQLLLTSSKFDEDAKSFTSKPKALKLSSNILAWDKISSKQVEILVIPPCIKLTDVDISKRPKLREYCISQ